MPRSNHERTPLMSSGIDALDGRDETTAADDGREFDIDAALPRVRDAEMRRHQVLRAVTGAGIDNGGGQQPARARLQDANFAAGQQPAAGGIGDLDKETATPRGRGRTWEP